MNKYFPLFVLQLHLYTVKCNLTKLTTKRSRYLSSGQRSAVGRAGSVPPSVVACFNVAYRSGLCSWAWSYPAGFILPSPFPLFPLFSSLWQVPGWLLVGAHGWVVGIASHGSVSLSRGWLISVEAPRHPGHLSSIQLDAVVNWWENVYSITLRSIRWYIWFKEGVTLSADVRLT